MNFWVVSSPRYDRYRASRHSRIWGIFCTLRRRSSLVFAIFGRQRETPRPPWRPLHPVRSTVRQPSVAAEHRGFHDAPRFAARGTISLIRVANSQHSLSLAAGAACARDSAVTAPCALLFPFSSQAIPITSDYKKRTGILFNFLFPLRRMSPRSSVEPTPRVAYTLYIASKLPAGIHGRETEA